MSRDYPSTYEAAEELRGIVDKAEELLNTISADGGEIAEELRTRVGDTVRAARDRLGALETSARKVSSHAAETADEYVTGHPWMAVAVAAALGAVVGAALLRR